MRITFKVATAAGSGVSRIPMPKWEIDRCYGEGDSMDVGKLSQSLDVPGVTFSSHDNGPVMCIANEFLVAMERIVKKMDSGSDGSKSSQIGVKKALRQIGRDRAAYVRFFIEWMCDHVRFKIDVDNPKQIVGDADNYSWMVAIDAARLLLHMKDRFLKQTNTVLEVCECDSTKGLLAEAQKQNDWFERHDAAENVRKGLLARRARCPHYKVGLCVASPDGNPPDSNCKMFCNGRCVEPQLPEDLRNAPLRSCERPI